jgi:hypothetical protein
VNIVFCQVEVSASVCSLIKRIPTDCGVSECDGETSIMGSPAPLGAVAPCKKFFHSSKRFYVILLNPLNAELNPICHLLVLLRDLTFMGPCIVSIFQYISNKM